MNKTRVKICCISSVKEAETAVKYGASALGLVSQMPSGPGVIPDELILEILGTVPVDIDTFFLTCETSASAIIDQNRKFNTTTLQLVDTVDESEYSKLKKELPEIKLVQVVHVTGKSSVDYAMRVSGFADAILLDSGNPDLKIKELGGTGRVHDWNYSRMIRNSVKIPVYLAGGLNPDNVSEAIEKVKPYAVDLCSGVRTAGKLDEVKLEKFFNSVNYTDNNVNN